MGATSAASLIAPRVLDLNGMFTKQVLFSKIPFESTTKEDRVRTCYMLACLAYVNFSAVGNADVRRLFGLDDSKRAQATRIIKDAIAAKLVKANDVAAPPKNTWYVPNWA